MLDYTLQYERETYTPTDVLLVSGVRLTGHRGRSCENCTYLERPEWRLPVRSLGSIAVARWHRNTRSLAGCTGSGGELRTQHGQDGRKIAEMKLSRRKKKYGIANYREIYTQDPILHGSSGLRLQAPGCTGRLGFRSLVPTGCPYGEFTLADAHGLAWAETGKHLTCTIQFNGKGWRALPG